MILTIYEELYQPPSKICFGVNCSENINPFNSPLKNFILNNYDSLPNDYLLKNHQNRTVVSKITKASQQGLEKRAENRKVKRIKLQSERSISDILKMGVQSKRSQKHRKKNKYKSYMTTTNSKVF